jgi:hypothetical protein
LIIRLPPPPADADDLGLPDLQAWVAFYGGYCKIPAKAWEHWDKLHEAHRKMKKLEGRETRVP